jgi:hypothetical protein
VSLLNEGFGGTTTVTKIPGLLGAASYDPAEAVSKSCEALLAMTALDTTNLRVAFKAPTSGNVQVRLKGQTHGATTAPRILLGVLEGATVKGRGAALGSFTGGLAATTQLAQEATFLVTGLEAGKEYTWDAAYGVEVVLASTGLKYGGPNDTVGNDAFGAFTFEVWEIPGLLAGTFYDPTSSVSKVITSLLAMTAFDTTNLRLKFKAPSSGKVRWRVRAQQNGSTTFGQVLLGVLEGSTVKGRSAPVMANSTTAVATSCLASESSGTVTGLTPETEYTWDAAYGVQVVGAAGAALKYGGPDNTTTNDAFGGLAFEVWTG